MAQGSPTSRRVGGQPSAARLRERVRPLEPPESVAAKTGSPRILAGLDGWDGSRLQGWAVDLMSPRAPVALRLEANGEPIWKFSTDAHRDDIAAVLKDNVAGFAIDFDALPDEAKSALAAALGEANRDQPPPAARMAIRVAADGSSIELDGGGAGVTAGAVLSRLGFGPPPSAAKPEELSVRPPAGVARDPGVARDANALRWLLAHFGADPPGVSPARRFAAHLLVEIEASTLVSPALKRHAAEISAVFDPFFYMERLSAPEEATGNPLLHYALAGWREALSPSPLFSPEYYKRLRGRVIGDPLLDFVREGAAANVDPHPLFDVAFYRQRHQTGQSNPLAHYLETGGRRRLDPSPLFDTPRFLQTFGLGDEIEIPLETFLTTPEYYDFAVAPAFDSRLYRYQLEIERGEKLDEPPYAHYLTRGFRDETLSPNLLFDPTHYRERNKLTYEGPALAHYLSEGEPAGLSCHPFFSSQVYARERGTSQAASLEHALAHPGEIRSDARMAGPIDPRLFALVDDLIAEKGAESFRPEIYRETNPDLLRFDEKTLKAHFKTTGEREGRLASLTQMMRLADFRVRDLPLGFVLDDYVSIYPDLGGLKDRFVSALYHYGRYGREERRLIGRWKFSIADLSLDVASAAAPLRVTEAAERVDVCILIHAFYPDLLPELVGFARNFRGVSFDVFINVVDAAWTPELQEELRAICPGAFVMLSNDNGRDVGGFTRLIGHVDIARYDLFAFMHSKKSPHISSETATYWRRALLSAIAGTPEIASDNVALFRERPEIGMIGSKDWRSHDMGKNVDQYERLLDLLGVRGKNRELDYLSGFMFLARASVVKALYETLHRLDFEYGGDKDLDYHIDGQIAHGVERAVPALVRQMGYEIHYR